MISKYRICLLLVCLIGSIPVVAQETLNEEACLAIGSDLRISASIIGEPVAAVNISSATWQTGGQNGLVHCRIDGELSPIDQAATARVIKFGVALPVTWNGRAIQMGGGGMNGNVPGLAGFGGQSDLARGYVTYGSDSGHAGNESEWALNDEAIRNLGYQQMKKTHDTAMAVINHVYGQLPEYNYYVGGSQGGREALTVVQRYSDDYDGVLATVPIVGFSSLMTGPTRMRIQEKSLDNWVPPVKGMAILSEFMRQCDDLDGLVDGVINNYVDCRAIFNINDGKGPEAPWQAKLCEGGIDSNPENAGIDACLTAGQIETLHLQFSNLDPGITLPHGRSSFGMWAPTTAVTGGGFGGLFTGSRYKGQEGAAADARVFSALGSIGVNGFYMQDINADPLEFNLADHGKRYEQLAPWLDSTQADLSDFADKGGKLIVMVGSDDTIAPSGEQLDYYQAVLDTMGRENVNNFARLYVLPQTGHGLTGNSATIDGKGNVIQAEAIPSSIDRFELLSSWVEEESSPGLSETVTGEAGSRPLCSYPNYPHYHSGDSTDATSWRCESPEYAE